MSTTFDVHNSRAHLPALSQAHQIYFDNAGGSQVLGAVSTAYMSPIPTPPFSPQHSLRGHQTPSYEPLSRIKRALYPRRKGAEGKEAEHDLTQKHTLG